MGQIWKKLGAIFSYCLITVAATSPAFVLIVAHKYEGILSHNHIRSNKGISLSVPRVKTNTGARAFHTCALPLWNNLLLSVHSAISVATFIKHLKTSFWLGLSPLHHGTPDGLLMLRNYLINFAVEHWFSCCTTKPGFAGDIGALEIWLIDWLKMWLFVKCSLLLNVGYNSVIAWNNHDEWKATNSAIYMHR